MDRNRAKKIAVFVVGYSTATGTSLIVRKFVNQQIDMTDTSRYQKLLVGIGTIAIAAFASERISNHAKKPVIELFDAYDKAFPKTKTEI